MSQVSMSRAAEGLDMLRLREISHDRPGVLAFLMARANGPPTTVSRPPLDCYLLGIGLNVATFRIEAGTRTLRRGTYGLHGLHLVQPTQQAHYHFTGKLANFRLRLSLEAVAAALEEMDRPSGGVELAEIPEQTDKILGRLSRRILRETLSAWPDPLLIDSLMQTLLDRIVTLNATRLAKPTARGELSSRALRAVEGFMRDHGGEPVSLARLSAVANLSRSHFLRAFRNSVGAPPHAFLSMIRLREASALIARTGMSLAEIAAATGFSSHAHMTTAFRATLGFTPSEFRDPARFGLSQDVTMLSA
jgi:AraC-like DNA-binding protein